MRAKGGGRDCSDTARRVRVLHVAASMSPSWGWPAHVLRELTLVLAEHGVESKVAITVGLRVVNAPISVPGVPVRGFDTGLLGCAWTAWSRGLSHRTGPRQACHFCLGDARRQVGAGNPGDRLQVGFAQVPV